MRWHRLTRRRLVVAGVALVILGFLGTLNTTTRYLALGLLRREPFYDGRPLSYWVYLIKTRDPEREHAFEVLGRLGPENSEAIPALTRVLEEGLHSESEMLRSVRRAWQSPKDEEEAQERAQQALAAAVEALGRIGPQAHDAIPVLVKYLGRGEAGNKAGTALVQIGPTTVPALLEVLADNRGTMDGSHRRALLALSRLGSGAREALPALLNILQTMDHNMPGGDGQRAVHALGKMGPEARAAVPVLMDTARKSQYWPLTRQVVESLGDIGPEAREAVPFLLDMRRKACSLHVNDIFLRKEIVRSLRQIDARAATEAAGIRPPWSDEAIHHYAQSNSRYKSRLARLDEAVRLEPRFTAAHIARGKIYDSVGDRERALADYNQAIRSSPEDANAYYGRATVYAALGEEKRAIADFDRSLDLSPARDAYNDLAWLLATSPNAALRDGLRAVRLARKACELSKWKSPAELDTLAAAYAEIGDFAEAVRWQQKALELFKSKNKSGDGAHERLRRYEAHKPYRQAWLAPTVASADLDAVPDYSFAAVGSSKCSAFLLCFRTLQGRLGARIERAAPLTGFIWDATDGGFGSGGTGPDGEYDHQSSALRIICSAETLESYLRALRNNFEKTARETTTEMINSKEELEDGHWVGFRFEYTCGQAHGSVSAELTDQDPDPDDPGRKIYYLVIIHEEKRP